MHNPKEMVEINNVPDLGGRGVRTRPLQKKKVRVDPGLKKHRNVVLKPPMVPRAGIYKHKIVIKH